MKHIYIKTIIICFISIFFSNCSPEDGIDGESGIDGIDGESGIDGEDGVNGEDGLDFDEISQLGSITITISGTRSDDVEFTDIKELKYVPSNAHIVGGNNFNQINESTYFFDVARFFTNPNLGHQGTYSFLTLNVSNVGEETESYQLGVEINENVLIFDDLSFITFTESYSIDSTVASNFTISNYSFDQETNQLIFSFDIDADVSSNDLFNSLYISGEVNTYVFEDID